MKTLAIANHTVPDWLMSFHRARESGLTLRHDWLVIQAGGLVGKSMPAISVTPGYRPRPNDDLSALVGLDCELLLDDQTPYSLAHGLVAAILGANPRSLWALTCGHKRRFVYLKKGRRHGV